MTGTARTTTTMLVSLFLAACATESGTDRPVVEAAGIAFSGAALEGGGAVFKGIPFAEAPVGKLRWRPPQPLAEGSGSREATDFAPACAQTDRLSVFYGNIAAAFGAGEDVVAHLGEAGEDCLYLNVWTPDLRPSDPLPVMVWFHGGSNTSGWSSELAYQGDDLASRGVVFVSVNYRLGPLGFFSHPALTAESEVEASGNYGLMDQAASLEWVRDHIAEFGGDPARVTIFGESAGASDVIHLMSAPEAQGLFHRAIAQSGAPMGAIPSLERAEASGVELAGSIGIEAPETAEGLVALRSMPVEDLIRAIDAETGGYSASVVVDGAFVTRPAGEVFLDGGQAAVPLMIGSNANEFSTLSYYLPDIDRTVEAYEEWVGSTYFFAAPRMLELYPAASDAEVAPALIQQVTDVAFTCPSRVAARRHARAGNPTFRYYFTRVSPGPGGEALGAYHGMEVPYVFNTRFDWLPTEEADLRLTEAMGQHWVAFARTGDPNVDGLAAWPAYDPETDAYLELGSEIRAGEGVTSGPCAFFDQVAGNTD